MVKIASRTLLKGQWLSLVSLEILCRPRVECDLPCPDTTCVESLSTVKFT